MVNILYTSVTGNSSSTLALTNGIGLEAGAVMVWGGIAHRGKSQLIVVEGTMIVIRYRDEILCPVAVPFMQQRQLTMPCHIIFRVCRNILANNNIVPLDWPPYNADLSLLEHLWDDLERKGKEASESPDHPCTVKKCFG